MANYYDNDKVQGLIEIYLDLIVKNEETKKFYLKEDIPANRELKQKLESKIFTEVGKIINGIIFTHKFTAFEPYDDLFQEASEACMKALPKFNPNFITSKGVKATSFNYFSLTAKRCLRFYTLRNAKNRNYAQIEDYDHLMKQPENDFSKQLLSEEFIKQLKTVFTNSKYKKFIPLIEILDEYLTKIGDYNKRDFFRFAKSNGWSPNLIRKFLKIMKENKEFFYKDAIQRDEENRYEIRS